MEVWLESDGGGRTLTVSLCEGIIRAVGGWVGGWGYCDAVGLSTQRPPPPPPQENPGGRGGGTESLSLGTNCETTAPPPFFWGGGEGGQRTAPRFSISIFTTPSKDSSLKSTLNDEFSISNMQYFTLSLYQEELRTHLNSYIRLI